MKEISRVCPFCKMDDSLWLEETVSTPCRVNDDNEVIKFSKSHSYADSIRIVCGRCEETVEDFR